MFLVHFLLCVQLERDGLCVICTRVEHWGFYYNVYNIGWMDRTDSCDKCGDLKRVWDLVERPFLHLLWLIEFDKYMVVEM